MSTPACLPASPTDIRSSTLSQESAHMPHAYLHHYVDKLQSSENLSRDEKSLTEPLTLRLHKQVTVLHSSVRMDAKYTVSFENFLKEDGTLNIQVWAQDLGVKDGHQHLSVDLAQRGVPMAHSSAMGEGLISNGAMGGDVIHVKAGHGFVPHTHPGDHLLIIIGGEGTITYGGKIYPTRAGQIFMIKGQVPHAVGAITDHSILAVGSPHKLVDDPERMAPVEYKQVTTDIEELHCLICDVRTKTPQRPHDRGCSHCPCYECVK